MRPPSTPAAIWPFSARTPVGDKVGELALAFGVGACRFSPSRRQRQKRGRFPAHSFEAIGERPAA